MTAELSIVVVTYSPGEMLANFIASLARATTREVRVVLADNGSVDGAPEAAASAADFVELLPTGGNLGYGRAANAGVAVTDTEWVLIANPDIVFSPGALDTMLAAAARWPRAGTLGPLIRTPQGSVYPSARSLPSLGSGAGHALFGWWWPSNPWSAKYRQDRAEPVERTAGWLSGSCLLIRREAFDSVDGFDPAYFMYFEDVDLGDRLGQAGWLNVYVPEAEVVHIGSHSTVNRAAAMNAEHHRSALHYLNGKYSGARWLPVRLTLRAGLSARQLLASTFSRVSGGARYQNERGATQ
ncbi:glycosyltransferase family 2 protein [Jatrophihabitans sp. DSM 45814]